MATTILCFWLVVNVYEIKRSVRSDTNMTVSNFNAHRGVERNFDRVFALSRCALERIFYAYSFSDFNQPFGELTR
jgi:hypothetical protein